MDQGKINDQITANSRPYTDKDAFIDLRHVHDWAAKQMGVTFDSTKAANATNWLEDRLGDLITERDAMLLWLTENCTAAQIHEATGKCLAARAARPKIPGGLEASLRRARMGLSEAQGGVQVNPDVPDLRTAPGIEIIREMSFEEARKFAEAFRETPRATFVQTPSGPGAHDDAALAAALAGQPTHFEPFRPAPSISHCGEEIARSLDNKLGLHLSHCNFGENAGQCKYGEDDCPALSESWSWLGNSLQQLARIKDSNEQRRNELRGKTAWHPFVVPDRPDFLAWREAGDHYELLTYNNALGDPIYITNTNALPDLTRSFNEAAERDLVEVVAEAIKEAHHDYHPTQSDYREMAVAALAAERKKIAADSLKVSSFSGKPPSYNVASVWSPSDPAAQEKVAEVMEKSRDNLILTSVEQIGEQIGAFTRDQGVEKAHARWPEWSEEKLRKLADAEPGGLMACSPELLEEFKEAAKTNEDIRQTLRAAGVEVPDQQRGEDEQPGTLEVEGDDGQPDQGGAPRRAQPGDPQGSEGGSILRSHEPSRETDRIEHQDVAEKTASRPATVGRQALTKLEAMHAKLKLRQQELDLITDVLHWIPLRKMNPTWFQARWRIENFLRVQVANLSKAIAIEEKK